MNPMFAIFKIEEIKNEALQTAANVALLVLAVLYLALIFWTFADARRRIDDPLLVACATLASFFPFIGTIVYRAGRTPTHNRQPKECHRVTLIVPRPRRDLTAPHRFCASA